MEAITKKDLSDIHRRIDLINTILIEMASLLSVELGNVSAEDFIEKLEGNTYDHIWEGEYKENDV